MNKGSRILSVLVVTLFLSCSHAPKVSESTLRSVQFKNFPAAVSSKQVADVFSKWMARASLKITDGNHTDGAMSGFCELASSQCQIFAKQSDLSPSELKSGGRIIFVMSVLKSKTLKYRLQAFYEVKSSLGVASGREILRVEFYRWIWKQVLAVSKV